jgi:RNA-directed DNA polymerase
MNKHVLNQWLNAGIIDKGKFEIFEEGVPQGGPASPTIFNLLLNGIEQAIMAGNTNPKRKNNNIYPIRYADDLIILSNDLTKLK